MIDAHVHVVDFLQDAAPPASLLDALDDAGIEAAVVFGLPVKKKWGAYEPNRPHYYLDDADSCYPWSATDDATARFVDRAPEPERLAPLACGVNPTDLDAARQVDRLLTDGPFVGVGELLLRHGRLSPLVHGGQGRANHPAVIAIGEVCARHGAPLVVHHNAGSTGQGPTAYVHELEALLDACPTLEVMWSHAGINEDHVAPPVDVLDDLLGRHPHLHADISWAATEVIEPPDRPAERWLEIVAGHPDRFLWGSDCVGRFDDLGPLADRFRGFLRLLPAAARSAVAGDNARRLFFDLA